MPIGKHIQCTLWSVEYRYRDPNHEPRPKVPGVKGRLLEAQLPPESDVITGKVLVVTADATGEDVYLVAKGVIEQTVGPVHDFAITGLSRFAESLRGLALLDITV